MDGKKISFGFMKTKKVDKPLIASQVEKKDYIECLEDQSIKVVGGEEEKDDAPLVIPMKPNTLVTADRLRQIAEEVEQSIQEPEIKKEVSIDTQQEPLPENETLEQKAVRELMQEAKKEVKVESSNIAIPTPAKTVIDGEKESTLDDYESVPIQEFGMAMLRGMGWTPSKESTKYKQPELRPKGLGLGADKVIKENQRKQTAKDSTGEELTIVKNSHVRITAGKYSGYYGKVVSLDEDNGRVMVEIPVKKETVSLSEFMMQAVTKSEYDRESKVINADSYEEYKKKELKSSKVEDNSSLKGRDDKERVRNNDSIKDVKERDRRIDRERRDDKDRRDDRERREDRNRRYDREEGVDENRWQRDNDSANVRSRNRYRSSSSEDRSSRKKKKDRRQSSSDSLKSLSEDDRKQKQSKHKSRKRRSRSRSNSRKRSPTTEGKRDIDKKRKGKKKKRDRDRSPNYKKHRK